MLLLLSRSIPIGKCLVRNERCEATEPNTGKNRDFCRLRKGMLSIMDILKNS